MDNSDGVRQHEPSPEQKIAEGLSRYYRALIFVGLPEALVERIVEDYAREVTKGAVDGFTVAHHNLS